MSTERYERSGEETANQRSAASHYWLRYSFNERVGFGLVGIGLQFR